MVWLVHTKREHTQKLKRNLRNFRCEGKLIKTECCKLALTEISSKPNGNACYASYASGDMIFLIFVWAKFHVFLWMVFNQQLQKGEKKLSWSLYSSWLECRKLHACTHRPPPRPRPILPRTHAHTCTASWKAELPRMWFSKVLVRGRARLSLILGLFTT